MAIITVILLMKRPGRARYRRTLTWSQEQGR